MEEFKKGHRIHLKNGTVAIVETTLGQGGQGIVYRVDVGGQKYALKWYLKDYLKSIDQKKFYQNLCSNQMAGAPSEDFLWMLDVSDYQADSFGYLMKLRPATFVGFSSYLNAEVKINSILVLLKTARNICRAFQSLHRLGYSYQDINDGNFFLNPQTGDVLVCDNDNVAPCGVWMGMGGKDRYMAPEVVLGKKRAGMESDLYSLAVILFMLFYVAHPLEGKAVHSCTCLTPQMMRKYYAEAPAFVFDPQNTSNRPVRGVDCNVLARWGLYPNELQTLFERSFTTGLHDAGYRVRENEWIECFENLIDRAFICTHCGGEQFYEYHQDPEKEIICEDCHHKTRKPFLWNDGKNERTLYVGKELPSRFVGEMSDKLFGTVIESRKHPGLWGICNQTNEIWSAMLPNGKEITVESGDTVPLFDGVSISIQNKKYKIKI